MKRQKKHCQHFMCGEFTEDGSNYCKQHRPTQQRQRIKKQYEKWYSLKQWITIRTSQLMKKPLCQECEKNGILTTATEVDHIKPHIGSFKDFIDRTNLQSLCKQCHSRKTWEENNNK